MGEMTTERIARLRRFLEAGCDIAPSEGLDLLETIQVRDEEITALRVGLDEIATWDAGSAKLHGDIGVREYARVLLARGNTEGET